MTKKPSSHEGGFLCFLDEYAAGALIVAYVGLHRAYVTKIEAKMASVSRRKYRIRATETSTLNS